MRHCLLNGLDDIGWSLRYWSLMMWGWTVSTFRWVLSHWGHLGAKDKLDRSMDGLMDQGSKDDFVMFAFHQRSYPTEGRSHWQLWGGDGPNSALQTLWEWNKLTGQKELHISLAGLCLKHPQTRKSMFFHAATELHWPRTVQDTAESKPKFVSVQRRPDLPALHRLCMACTGLLHAERENLRWGRYFPYSSLSTLPIQPKFLHLFSHPTSTLEWQKAFWLAPQWTLNLQRETANWQRGNCGESRVVCQRLMSVLNVLQQLRRRILSCCILRSKCRSCSGLWMFVAACCLAAAVLDPWLCRYGWGTFAILVAAFAWCRCFCRCWLILLPILIAWLLVLVLLLPLALVRVAAQPCGVFSETVHLVLRHCLLCVSPVVDSYRRNWILKLHENKLWHLSLTAHTVCHRECHRARCSSGTRSQGDFVTLIVSSVQKIRYCNLHASSLCPRQDDGEAEIIRIRTQTVWWPGNIRIIRTWTFDKIYI